MNKLALITGATSGFGQATAVKLAANKFDLIITGRRKEKLIELKSRLESEYSIEVQTLCFDIRNKDEVDLAFSQIIRQSDIEILVNNAGLASGINPIHQGDIDDWERMIDTNIKGLLYITRLVSPIMVEKQRGHIINIGSIAGRQVYQSGNVYCASKFAVNALTQGMRIDLAPFGIKVSQVSPGAAETEFSIVRFHGDSSRAKNVYAGFEPLLAEDIADAILYMITRPPHVNIDDMLIMPTAQPCATIFHRKQ
jgi:3-hydroxy acid dehydrogenase/malonic semialdehyde reductase